MVNNDDDSRELTMAMSTTLVALANSLTLQNSIAGLSTYDGSNIPLKDFIQDIRNGDLGITNEQRPSYLRAVLGKLQGPAKDCTYGKTFTNIEQLCTHLKQRFAPGKGFAYYSNKLYTLRMRPGDSTGCFKDQINILLQCAKSALKEEKGRTYHESMITTLKEACVDIFIRGLPGHLGQLVDSRKPVTLEEAYEEAVRLEARMDARIIPDTRHRHGYQEPKYQYGQPPQHLNYQGARFDTNGASLTLPSDTSDPIFGITM